MSDRNQRSSPGPLRAGALRRVALSAACLVAALVSACASTPRGAPAASWTEYLEIARTLREAGPTLGPGSDGEQRAIARFQALLADFKAADFASRIPEVYAEEVFFNDTLKTLRGVDEVADHLTATAEALEVGRVEFLDTTSADGDYYLRWVMRVRSPRLAGGEEVLSAGMSHLRFDADGRVVLHQDFWDSTGGLFEHVPALGWLLRRAKHRL